MTLLTPVQTLVTTVSVPSGTSYNTSPTLTSAVTAGNTVLMALSVYNAADSNVIVTAPSGWTKLAELNPAALGGTLGNDVLYLGMWAFENAAASQTLGTWNVIGVGQFYANFTAMEYAGLFFSGIQDGTGDYSYVGNTGSYTQASRSLTINGGGVGGIPASTNEMALMFVTSGNGVAGNSAPATPAGWTLVANASSFTTGMPAQVYAAQATTSKPAATFSWTVDRDCISILGVLVKQLGVGAAGSSVSSGGVGAVSVTCGAAGTSTSSGSAGPNVPSAYSTVVLADNPLGYWRFNEATGTLANDTSPNNNDGSYTGTVSLGYATPLKGLTTGGAALDLTAATGYVLVPAASYLDLTSAVTLECWAKSNTTTPANFTGVIFHGASPHYGYSLQFQNDRACFTIQTGSSQAQAFAPFVVDTAWHHYAATYNQSQMYLYIDGVQVQNTASTAAIANVTPTVDLEIGNITGNTLTWPGQLTEVALYGTALSASRVAVHYNTGVGLNLVAAGGSSSSGTANAGFPQAKGTSVSSGAVGQQRHLAAAVGTSTSSGAVGQQRHLAAAAASSSSTGAVTAVNVADRAAGTSSSSGTAAASAKAMPSASGASTSTATALARLNVFAATAGTSTSSGVAGLFRVAAASGSSASSGTVGQQQNLAGASGGSIGYGAGIANLPASAYAAVVLADTPIAYWRLNDAALPLAADSGPNAIAAAYTGITSLGAGSPIVGDTTASSVSLITTQGYVTVPPNPILDVTTAVTVECWFQSTVTTTNPNVPIFDHGGSSGAYGYTLEATNSGNTLQWVIGDGTTQHILNGTGSWDTLWHHIVCTYDGANQYLYYDGFRVPGLATTGAIAYPGTKFDLEIGNATGNAAGTFTFPGRVAEAAVYNYALSQARVTVHFQTGLGRMLVASGTSISTGSTRTGLAAAASGSSSSSGSVTAVNVGMHTAAAGSVSSGVVSASQYLQVASGVSTSVGHATAFVTQTGSAADSSTSAGTATALQVGVLSDTAAGSSSSSGAVSQQRHLAAASGTSTSSSVAAMVQALTDSTVNVPSTSSGTAAVVATGTTGGTGAAAGTSITYGTCLAFVFITASVQ